MKGPKESEIITVERPVINKPTEILVKIHYCGVCMSEHYDWTTAPVGRSFGHEPMGTVVEVGSGVTKVKVGDRVSMGAGGGAEYQKLDEKWVQEMLPLGEEMLQESGYRLAKALNTLFSNKYVKNK